MWSISCFIFLVSGTVYSEILEAFTQETFSLIINKDSQPNHPVEITTSASLDSSVKNLGVKNTVHFSVSYEGHFSRWTLELAPGEQEGSIQKTLCHAGSSNSTSAEQQSNEKIYIVAYSRSVNNLKLDISAGRNERFNLESGHAVEVEVTPFSSQIFQFFPSSGEPAVMLTVEDDADDYICMFVAINPPTCPWHDSTQTIQNSRIWSRVLKLGYFTIQTKDFPQGFQVTLISVANNEECISQVNDQEVTTKSKRVRLSIESLNLNYNYPISVSISMLVFLSVLFTTVWLLLWYCWTKPNYEEGGEEEEQFKGQNSLESNGNQAENAGVSTEDEEDALLKALREAGLVTEDVEEKTALQAAVRRLRQQIKGDLNLTDMIHMTKRDVWHRRVRSYGYIFVVPLVSCFYFVPSVQMVMAEWFRSEDTGNRDRCYHNHGCSMPYGPFPDFNHTISNAGYIIYGLVFIGIVFLKSRILPDEHKTDQNHDTKTGILQQFSIFYTLGICMVFQGIFSSIFHLCPSNVSLQFDTTMMYLMMILALIKVFQYRHPDTSANVFTTMYIFFGVILAESISLYVTNFAIKVIFNTVCACLYLLLIINGCIENYYYGVVKVSYRTTIPVLCQYIGDSPRHPFRTGLMVIFFIINLALVTVLYTKALVSGENEVSGLSSPILVLCAVNVFLYLSKYLIRKIIEIFQEHREQTPGKFFRLLILIINLASFLIVGVFAAYFYSHKHQSRNLSPAESRNMNTLCTVGNFFDNHDMWHFLSSTALFLAFIFLLTIDDDLFNINKEQIKVY